MTKSVQSRFHNAAYGKPKNIKGAGTVINVGSNVGARIAQVAYFRTVAFGYRTGKGVKRGK